MQICSYFIEKMIPLLFKDVFLRIIICADRLYAWHVYPHRTTRHRWKPLSADFFSQVFLLSSSAYYILLDVCRFLPSHDKQSRSLDFNVTK